MTDGVGGVGGQYLYAALCGGVALGADVTLAGTMKDVSFGERELRMTCLRHKVSSASEPDISQWWLKAVMV